MTDHDNPYSAGIYDNDSRSRDTRRAASTERLRAALAAVEKYADCGDNSCQFAGPQRRRGMGTNGGCTCVERGRPFVVAALAELVRAARAATAAEPTLPAEPAVSERRAPVQPVYKGGRVVKGDGTVSWAEHELAWQEYARRYRSDQSAERIAERHGFDYNELTMFLGHEPQTWRPR